MDLLAVCSPLDLTYHRQKGSIVATHNCEDFSLGQIRFDDSDRPTGYGTDWLCLVCAGGAYPTDCPYFSEEDFGDDFTAHAIDCDYCRDLAIERAELATPELAIWYVGLDFEDIEL